MKLPYSQKIKWNYLGLAFAFPVIGMLIMMAIRSMEPFGNSSMLYSDMYHQYFPFFVAFRKALLSGDSLLYSWSVGMGMDYLGLISYYLASPLNLLSVLVPEGLLLEFFSLLAPIKLGLASMFFAFFLKKIFRKNDLSITLFGVFYGMCAWAMGYHWNIMWMDTFALLPLVALGTVSLLREKKFFLYTITLFLSVFSNYYIGFFICIFVFLLFFVYQICRWHGFKRFFFDLCRIAFFSILAIGMTAILELPAFAALQTTQSSVNNFPEGFRLNIADENTWKGLLDAMRQVAGNMGGGLEPSFKEGLPNLYCGVGTILLSVLFLTCKRVKLRDKICSILLLLFFMVSFIIRQLDYIWHGFHFTNMIPYRFSFLFCFVVLYMAYRAFLMRNRFRPWQVILGAVLAATILACSDSRTDPVFLAYNIIFLILYCIAFLSGAVYKARRPRTNAHEAQDEAIDTEAARTERLSAIVQRRTVASYTLAVIMTLELILNIVNFAVNFPATGVSNYPRGTNYAKSMITYMHEREDDTQFFRAETTHSQTLNDGALNGYNGISTFTSSANVKTTVFMQALGYGAKNTYNRYCFEESSPIANLFLNLKYMIERENPKENPYFDNLRTYGTVSLLENNAYLPLGFLAQPQLANIEFRDTADQFSMQNRLLCAASGVEGNAWYKLSGRDLEIAGYNSTILNKNGAGYSTYQTEDIAGSVVYTYTADREGLLCIDLDLSKRNKYTVSINDTELFSETYSLPQMLSVCTVRPGDTIDILLTCAKNEKGTINIQAAILDETLFRQAYDALAANTLKLTEFGNTRVSGTITCDHDGLLYTSIPQDGNWHAYIDGKEAEIILIGDTMVGVSMTAGDHEITFRYENKAFSLGWKISLGCAAIFAALSIWLYHKPHKKGKYEK